MSNIIKEWISKENPEVFFFSAKEPSRIKLYNRFAKVIENETNYKFDEELNDFIDDVYETEWKFYTFSK